MLLRWYAYIYTRTLKNCKGLRYCGMDFSQMANEILMDSHECTYVFYLYKFNFHLKKNKKYFIYKHVYLYTCIWVNSTGPMINVVKTIIYFDFV